MRWRFRTQEAFYLAMNFLSHKNLPRLDQLDKPVNWFVIPKERNVVDQILACFELVQQCLTREPASPGSYCPGNFDAPVGWLATLVLRCYSDVELTLEMLENRKYLGEVDFEKLRRVNQAQIKIEENRREIKAIHYQIKPVYCFWLPIRFGGRHDVDFVRELASSISAYEGPV